MESIVDPLILGNSQLVASLTVLAHAGSDGIAGVLGDASS